MLITEEHFAHHYGLTTFGVKQLDKLRRASSVDIDKTIEGLASYRILDNHLY